MSIVRPRGFFADEGGEDEGDDGGFILLNTMLQWSALLYSFTSLRDIVHDYEKTANPNSKGVTHAFNNPELIYTQLSPPLSKKWSPYKGTHLKYPVIAKDILKFIHANRSYLTDDSGTIKFNPKGDSPPASEKKLMISQRLDEVDDFDAAIVEFDDEFVEEGLNSELVFAIIVNRTQERVTVVFRGSVSIKDLIIDANGGKVVPELIGDFATKGVEVHAGFSEYLFGDTLDENGMNKYQQIVDVLKQVYGKKMYRDYGLYITGHSLGGALSQLLAFTIAGRLEMDFKVGPKRVIAISYASPRVGNKKYQSEFTALECEGKLRHIRLTNMGDCVPVAPNFGFYQTGINLHLNPNGRMLCEHNNSTSFFSQFNLGALSKHSLPAYLLHMFDKENKDILKMSVDDLYFKYGYLETYDIDMLRSEDEDSDIFSCCKPPGKK